MEPAWVAAAAEWRLDGDRALLATLQQLHQRIVCGCEEVSSALRRLAAAARAADLGLRAQDDRLAAISSRQFVERRVYDDHLELAAAPAPGDDASGQQPTEEDTLLCRLRCGVAAATAAHIAVHIADSDSDTDSGGGSVVLRAAPVYGRPLPRVVGGPGFASDPHAGLRPTSDIDTDTDSSSDAEDAHNAHDARSNRSVVSDAPGDRYSDVAEEKVVTEEPAQQAARLAAVLGAQTQQIQPRPPSPPPPPRAGIGLPHNAAPIFPWAPPPPPAASEPSDDDDVPHVDDDDDDIFQELRSEKPTPTVAAAPPPTNAKKPIGGVSVFGNMASSGIPPRPKTTEIETPVKEKDTPVKDTDIFDHLFAKTTNKTAKVQEEKKDKKDDIFSDNIFDDIDNVFASAVPKVTKNTRYEEDDSLFADVTINNSKEAIVKSDKKPSIFDSDDDLFSENITVKNNVTKPETTNKKEISQSISVKETTKPKVIEQAKSIFDSDEDDIFAEISIKNDVNKIEDVKPVTQTDKYKDLFLDDDVDELFNRNASKTINNQDNSNKTPKSAVITKLNKTENIFDDCPSDDDLFSSKITTKQPPKAAKQKATEKPKNNLEIQKEVKTQEKQNILFNDNDDIDDVFKPKQKLSERQDIKQQNDKDSNSNEIQSNEWDDDEDIFKHNSKKTEQELQTDNFNDDTSKVDKIGTKVGKITDNSKTENKKEQIVEDLGDLSVTDVKAVLDNNNATPDTTSGPTTVKPGNIVEKPVKSVEKPSIDEIKTKPTKLESPESESIKSIDKVEVNPEILEKPLINDVLSENAPVIAQKPTSKPDDIVITENVNVKTTDAFKSIPVIAEITTIKNEDFITIENIIKTTDAFKSDGFSSIFHDAPPDFDNSDNEGTKNVNALFDDDIDYDQADDDNYDIPSTSDVPLPAFVDEPPEIDDDDLFKVKKSKPEIKKVFDDIFNDESDIFGDINVPQTIQTVASDVAKPETKKEVSKQTIDDLFQDDPNDFFKVGKEPTSDTSDYLKTSDVAKPETKKEVPKPKIEDLFQDDDSNDLFKVTKEPETKTTSDVPDFSNTSDAPTERKIGKLKPNTLNIDVKKLVPGVKVLRREEKTDIQNEEVLPQPGTEPEAGGLLDNTAAKGRARIQVKRRPSSRRARHRALADTDNTLTVTDSSSIVTDSSLTADIPDFIDNTPSPTDNTISFTESEGVSEIHDVEVGVQNKSRKKTIEELLKDSSEDETDENIGKDVKTEEFLKDSSKEEVIEKDKKIKVKSKIVYVLNDEDIFSKDDDDDDLFRGNVKTDKQTKEEKKDVVSEKDKLEKDVPKVKDTVKKERKSIFDDLSDDERDLFTNTRTNKPNDTFSKRDSNIQDNTRAKETKELVDSDEELFKIKRDINTGATASGKEIKVVKNVTLLESKDDLLKNTDNDPLSALWDVDDEDDFSSG